jgi:hypothetical protein
MREEQHEQDSWQGSLFAPDSLAPPARAPGSTPDPFAGARPAPPAPQRHESAAGDAVAPPTSRRERSAPGDAVAPPADAEFGIAPGDAARYDAPSGSARAVAYASPPPGVAPPAPPVAAPDEAVVLADDLDDLAELEPAHACPSPTRSLLAGPTLDDVMSRAWEGLRAEVPTPCPVCHAEIEPAAGGRCGGCGSTLD